MNAVLLIWGLALLLAAMAIGLWWYAGIRQQRRAQERHLLKHLDETRDTASPSAESVHSSLPHSSHPLDELLLRAGLSPGWRVPALALVALAVVVALATWRMHNILGGVIAAAMFAAVLVFWFGVRIQRQRRKLVAALPDFLENIVRLITIGQSLQMAFQNGATRTTGPLRDVLDRTSRRMRAGMDLEDALHMAAQGYRIEELELLESVLRMSSRYGGRTDLILQRMSDFMRDLAQAQQDLRSITSETRTASWVLGALPVVTGGAMMLLNPTFFTPMIAQPLGHRLLLIALCLQLFGAFLLYRLTKSL